MKRGLLNAIYLLAGIGLLPWILWRRIARSRPLGNPLQRLFGFAPRSGDDRQVVWLHAVSVGEVNQLDTLIEELARRRPDLQIAVSTTTATGMALLRKKHPELKSFYFPWDFSWSVRNAMSRLRPAMIVLTELEVWPNFMDVADSLRIPVAVINGRLSEKSFRGYRRFAWITRGMFGKLGQVITQDVDYAERFAAAGVEADRIHITGSIKYDAAIRQAIRHAGNGGPAEPGSIADWIRPQDGSLLLVAGSTQEGEELMIARIWRRVSRLVPQLRLTIVPRHPHRCADIRESLESEGFRVCLRSEKTQPANAEDANEIIRVVDTIGELGACWALADIAFVGGSFGARGGQNMLEPAAAGCAPVFGPDTWNFRQIVIDMKAAGAGAEVKDETALEMFVLRAASDSAFRNGMARRAREFVKTKSGATCRTVDLLCRILPQAESGVAISVSKKAA